MAPQDPRKALLRLVSSANPAVSYYGVAVQLSTAAREQVSTVVEVQADTTVEVDVNSGLTLPADGMLELPTAAKIGSTGHGTGLVRYAVPEPMEGPLATIMALIAFYHERGEPTGLTRLSTGVWQVQPRGYRV